MAEVMLFKIPVHTSNTAHLHVFFFMCSRSCLWVSALYPHQSHLWNGEHLSIVGRGREIVDLQESGSDAGCAGPTFFVESDTLVEILILASIRLIFLNMDAFSSFVTVASAGETFADFVK